MTKIYFFYKNLLFMNLFYIIFVAKSIGGIVPVLKLLQ